MKSLYKKPIYAFHIIAKYKAVVREEQKPRTSSSHDNREVVGRYSNTCDKSWSLYSEADKSTK